MTSFFTKNVHYGITNKAKILLEIPTKTELYLKYFEA